jgi:hypothetical protein
MTETIDRLIHARFDRVANPLDDADWSDVLARARGAGHRRRVPSRLLLAAVIGVLAATVTAVAFGWRQTFIDFFSSPSAPEQVKNFFGSQNVAAPSGMSPEAIPGQARKIATATFDASGLHPDRPTLHTLYVAPRRGGGFCYEWTNFSGSCADPTSTAAYARTHPAARPLGVSWIGDDFPLVVGGTIRAGTAKTVQARFGDGTTVTIPVTWVSPPIDAGFFAYPVPPAHQTRADALASVVALDANGNVIGRQDFRLTNPLDEDVPQTLPDGTKTLLSRRAEMSTARKVIGFRSTNGTDIYLWVMQRTGGGYCWVFNRGGGCPPAGSLSGVHGAFSAGLASGADPILLYAQTKPEVAALELHYQDGTGERLTPVDGWVLTEITPDHYKQGARLTAAVALDASGKEISRQRFQTRDPGVYPCQAPKSLGYGVRACP